MRLYPTISLLCCFLVTLAEGAFSQEIKARDGDTITATARGKSDEVKVRQNRQLTDLVVRTFTIDARQNAEGEWYWDAPATIVNTGADMSQRFDLKLEVLDIWNQGPDAKWRGMAYSRTSHPPLKSGQKTTIHWRTDTPTATANRPNLVHHVHRAVRVVVDPDDHIREAVETNNIKTLWRLSCDKEVAEDAPLTSVVWAETEPHSDRASFDDFARLISDKDVESRKQAVLCYIRFEAKRRARQTGATTAGTPFLDNLVTHFLDDYLADPTPENGAAAVSTIGEPQMFPQVDIGVKLWVPKGLRDRYPHVPVSWQWIYPATQFWSQDHGELWIADLVKVADIEFVGDNIEKMPLIDVPFLVGKSYAQTDVNADYVNGGKNLSQSMHWATGVKYWYLPRNAMRELFIGYEYWHMEGFDVFGEDAINDLIAEEMGRMLGERLVRGTIRTKKDLIRAMDEDFLAARAWVGAMLRLRQDKFDALILQPKVPKSHTWWITRKRVSPWAKQSLHQLLENKSIDDVIKSGQVEQLVQIYTLIYEVDEWEKRNRPVELTDTVRGIVNDEYNEIFESAPKANDAQWEWVR